MISPVLFSVVAAAAAVAAAQSVDISAIQAHFNQSHVVPDLLQSFDPSATLTVNFQGVGDISPGQPLSKDRK
jgi:phosphatidylethanolamine-binding protein